jgi:DNA-binding MarR family transcriptional regulator
MPTIGMATALDTLARGMDVLGHLELPRVRADGGAAVDEGPDGGAGIDERAGAAAGVDAFLDAFDAFTQAVRRARGATTQSDNGVLTLSQYALLQALATREEARVRELASEAGIAASTATRILDALERRKIVRRMRSSDDRRAVTVTLTSFGRDVLGSQHEWLRGRERAFYASLPAVERNLAPDLLLRLAALIDELAGGPGS